MIANKKILHLKNRTKLKGSYKNKYPLVYDSGATVTVVNDITLLSEVKDSNIEVTTAEGETSYAQAEGTLLITVNGLDIKLKEVLYIPEIKLNLISIKQFEDLGFSILISDYHMFVLHNAHAPIVVAKYCKKDDLYSGPVSGKYLMNKDSKQSKILTDAMAKLDISNTTPAKPSMEKKLVGEDLVTTLKGRESKLKLNYIGIHNIPQEVADKYMVQDLYYYHLLINHLSLEKLELLKKTGKINPVGSKTAESAILNCPLCAAAHGKLASRNKHPQTSVVRSLQRLHIDTVGPFCTTVLKKYISTVIDQFSSYTEIIVSDVKGIKTRIMEKLKIWNNRFNHRITSVRSDNAAELPNKDDLEPMGIEHHVIPNGTPALNGVAESTNRPIISNIYKTVLNFDANILFLFDYIAEYLVHIRNHTVAKNQTQTPFERYYNLSSYKITYVQFGVDVAIKLTSYQEAATLKLPFAKEKSFPMVVYGAFIGYTQDSTTFKVLVSTKGYPVIVTGNIKILASMSVINDYTQYMKQNSKIKFTDTYLSPLINFPLDQHRQENTDLDEINDMTSTTSFDNINDAFLDEPPHDSRPVELIVPDNTDLGHSNLGINKIDQPPSSEVVKSTTRTLHQPLISGEGNPPESLLSNDVRGKTLSDDYDSVPQTTILGVADDQRDMVTTNAITDSIVGVDLHTNLSNPPQPQITSSGEKEINEEEVNDALVEAQQMNSHIVVENESTIPDDDEYQTANENNYITDTDTESESEHEENLPPDESNTNGPSQIAVESVESNKTFENYHNRSESIEPKINKELSPDFNQTLEDINESMNHINEENLDEFDKSIMDDQNLDDAIESLHNELVINNNKIDYVEDLVNKRKRDNHLLPANKYIKNNYKTPGIIVSQNKSQAQILDELKPPKDKYSNAPFKSKRGKKGFKPPYVTRSGRKVQAPARYLNAIINKIDYNDPNWRRSMDEEIEKFKLKNVFEVVKIPPGVKPITTRWVHTYKEKDLKNKSFKSRCVVHGQKMVEDTHYNPYKISSPVVDLVSIRLLTIIAVEKGLSMHLLDISSAYLNADLEDNREIFIYPPKCYEVGKNHCWKLNKSLYGMRQSGYNWYNHFRRILINNGMTQTLHNDGIFAKQFENGDVLYLTIYVDDVFIIGNTAKVIEDFVTMLENHFELTYFGETTEYLGINFNRNGDTFTLDQKPFLEKLVDNFNILDSYGKNIPVIPNDINVVRKLRKSDEINDFIKIERPHHLINAITKTTYIEPDDDEKRIPDFESPPQAELLDAKGIKLYQSAVGLLLWATMNTRPDLSFIVNVLGSKCSNPDTNDWKKLIYCLRYVKNHLDFKLEYKKGRLLKLEQDFIIEVFSDASFAPELDRRSITGMAIYVNGNLVNWATKRQKIITHSSAACEMLALNYSVLKAFDLRNTIRDIGLKVKNIHIHEDNKAVITILQNDNFHPHRPIDICYKFLRQKLNDGYFSISYVESKDNLADSFTKPLGMRKLNEHTRRIIKREDYDGETTLIVDVRKIKEIKQNNETNHHMEF